MEILLTNDDGPESPLLLFLLEKLSEFGRVVTVVPKHEQSWRGKAITRGKALALEEAMVGPFCAFTLDGTPADCVNLAVYHLFEKKPELVVSGINIGINTGCAFLWSSGTVGACLEGNLAGIPGIALSQMLDGPATELLRARRPLPEDEHARLRAQTHRVARGTAGRRL
jgi:5'-nucleotidase